MTSKGVFFEGEVIKSSRGENLSSRWSGQDFTLQGDAYNARDRVRPCSAPAGKSRPYSACSSARQDDVKIGSGSRTDLENVRHHLRVRPQSAVELGGSRNNWPRTPPLGATIEEKHAKLLQMNGRRVRAGSAGRSRLGYTAGLGRSSSCAGSLLPRDLLVSDIHSEIERIQALADRERAKIAADEAELVRMCAVKSVELNKQKNLLVLTFPADGTRLMVKRWSKGFVIHGPRNKGPPLKPRIDTLDGSHVLANQVAQREKRKAELAAKEQRQADLGGYAYEDECTLPEQVQEEMQAIAAAQQALGAALLQEDHVYEEKLQPVTETESGFGVVGRATSK